jgi:adenosine deaminase
MAADGVTYGEIRWAPRLHLERGLGASDVIEAVAEGVAQTRERLGHGAPMIGLIVTAMRQHPPGANVELAHHAAAFGPPVVGFDLAGPEAAYPAPPHAAAFRAAQAAGLGLTAHAGETPGSARIWEALEFGVSRVAHGTTADGDAELVAALRTRGITLDLCPTSNVQSGVVGDLGEHPVTRLHRAGVSVTLSTDDRTVSRTTLSTEMAGVAIATGMTADELAEIAINGFRRGFSSPLELAPLRAEAARAWRAWAAGPNPLNP